MKPLTAGSVSRQTVSKHAVVADQIGSLDAICCCHILGPPRQTKEDILYNYYRYIRKWDRQDARFQAVAHAYESIVPEGDGGTDLPGNGTLFYTPDAGLIR